MPWRFQCRTSSIPTHFECKPIATKIKPIISESLTPDKITSPDSVRAASLESTNRTEFFISSSSSSLQSGLLAPTAKVTKPMNLGAMFKTNSNYILFKRHVWSNNGHYYWNAIYKIYSVSLGEILIDRTTKKHIWYVSKTSLSEKSE